MIGPLARHLAGVQCGLIVGHGLCLCNWQNSLIWVPLNLNKEEQAQEEIH